jgi:hypothetical protein
MQLPEPVAEFLAQYQEPWAEVSPVARWTLLLSLGAFFIYAWFSASGFLFIDLVNLVIHEAGHPLFSYFGETLHVWGGTLLELIVPAALALGFAYQRQLTGAAFCAFFFFENFLYIGVYMADARAQGLPLVTVGAPGDEAEHDWTHIFGQLGLLRHDVQIGHATRLLGWCGMLGVLAWYFWRTRAHAEPLASSRAAGR